MGKGSVQSCSCCQWSPGCRDFLPNVHPLGLLSARRAGGDPARPPVSHLGVPAKSEKGPSAWVREKLGTHGCLHGLVPKTKKKESEISLGSMSDSQMSPGVGLQPRENSHPGHPMFSAWKAALTAYCQQNAWAGRARTPLWFLLTAL